MRLLSTYLAPIVLISAPSYAQRPCNEGLAEVCTQSDLDRVKRELFNIEKKIKASRQTPVQLKWVDDRINEASEREQFCDSYYTSGPSLTFVCKVDVYYNAISALNSVPLQDVALADSGTFNDSPGSYAEKPSADVRDENKTDNSGKKEMFVPEVLATSGTSSSKDVSNGNGSVSDSSKKMVPIIPLSILNIAAFLFFIIARRRTKNIAALTSGNSAMREDYFGPLNAEQKKRFIDSVEKAESKSSTSHFWINICLASIMLVAMDFVVRAVDNKSLMLFLLPGAFFYVKATILVRKQIKALKPLRIAKMVEAQASDLSCEKCKAVFAKVTRVLDKQLLQAIPRPTGFVGPRDSNGGRSVTESYWTEARYKITKRDSCFCCDYESEYVVQETKRENYTTSTYRE